MGWPSRIRWTRAARIVGIATGAIAVFAAVVALGDAPPPRLADDIGVRMTAPATYEPPVANDSHPRAAGGVLARAAAEGFARESRRRRPARRASVPGADEKAAQPPREQPAAPVQAPAPAPAPAEPIAAPPAPPAAPTPPAPVPAVAAAPQPQPQPTFAGDGEFGFEN